MFYRKIKDTNIKYLGAAIKNTSGYYLRCCEINHENNILTIDKWVTCTKCYYSYKIDSQGMIIKKILNEHIIHNESNIYHEIKCKNNKCIHINKKIIKLCNKCKKNKEFEESIYFYDEVDENVIGSKIINKSIKFDYEEIYKHGELYQIGLDDGIEMHKKNVLYNYYKNYNKNLIKDIKTQKVLQNKALRCYSIMKLFNQDKYKIIQNKIKNIGFNINLMSQIDDENFNNFKNYLNDKLDHFVDDYNNKLSINNLEENFLKNNENISNQNLLVY